MLISIIVSARLLLLIVKSHSPYVAMCLCGAAITVDQRYLSCALASACLLSGTDRSCIKTHRRAGTCPQLSFIQP